MVLAREICCCFQEKSGGFRIILTFEKPKVSHALAMEPLMSPPDVSHYPAKALPITPDYKGLPNAILKKRIFLIQLAVYNHVGWAYPRGVLRINGAGQPDEFIALAPSSYWMNVKHQDCLLQSFEVFQQCHAVFGRELA